MDTDYFDRRVVEMTDEFKRALVTVKTDLLQTVENKFDPNKADSYTKQINRFFEEKMDNFERTQKNAQQELENSAKDVAEKMNKSLNPDIRTSYLGRLQDIIEQFRSQIQNDFNIESEGSITHDLKRLLQETVGEDGQLMKVINRRLSFDNPDSVFSVLRNDLISKLNAIEHEIATIKGAQSVMAKSTQKGGKFEDVLFEVLETFAQKHSAVVEKTARTAGELLNCMKGDFVISFPVLDKRIVVEAKNGKMNSLPLRLQEMELSKANRNADYVICIHAEESQLGTQVGLFQEYPTDKIITHIGLLEVAFKMAISRIMLEFETVEGIDKAAIEQEIATIKSSLRTLDTIKRAAKNIVQQADNIREEAEKTKLQISDSLITLKDILKMTIE